MNDTQKRQRKVARARTLGAWLGLAVFISLFVSLFVYLRWQTLERKAEQAKQEVRYEAIQDHQCKTCSQPQRYTSRRSTILPLDGRDLRVYYYKSGEAAVNLAERQLIQSRFKAFEAITETLKFTETQNEADSDIRVSADETDGAWSYVGSTVLQISKFRPTMNIGFMDRKFIAKNGKVFETYRVIDHEILHTLGLGHEQFNSNGGIVWKEEAAYRYFERIGWTRADVDNNVFRKNSDALFDQSEMDAESIMLYYFPCSITETQRYCERINRYMSRLDSSWLTKHYGDPRSTIHQNTTAEFTRQEWDRIFQEHIKTKE